MRHTKRIAALTAFALLCGMTGCAPKPQPAPPEEDVIVTITDPPTTQPPTTRPPTEAATEDLTEETEDQLEPVNSAESGQAYLAIVDSAWYIKYLGNAEAADEGDTGWYLAYDAGITDIAGNGTYTVSVNADTKGFRLASTDNIEGTNIPQGLSYLGVVIRDGADFMPDAIITIDKVKVDGKEIELTGKSITTTGEDRGTGDPAVMSVIYDPQAEELPKDARCADGDVEDQDDADEYSVQIINPEDFAEWQKVEVTFTISGLDEPDTGSHGSADDSEEETEETETTGDDE